MFAYKNGFQCCYYILGKKIRSLFSFTYNVVGLVVCALIRVAVRRYYELKWENTARGDTILLNKLSHANYKAFTLHILPHSDIYRQPLYFRKRNRLPFFHSSLIFFHFVARYSLYYTSTQPEIIAFSRHEAHIIKKRFRNAFGRIGGGVATVLVIKFI